MRLRSHLLLFTLGTLLPMVIFAAAAVAFVGSRERATFERGARERTLAILTAVDAELARSATTLEALATSPQLDRDDLRAFHAEASRVLLSQPHWIDISLAAPNGERMLSALHPYGEALAPVAARASFETVLRLRKPAIRNLAGEQPGKWSYGVRVPVVRGGELRYVLSATVSPQAIAEPLARQRLPRDWLGVVLDANGRIVARTLAPEKNLGRPASQGLREARLRAAEGWFRGATLEGAAVYTPYTASHYSGWTVALGIPAAEVEAVAVETAWLLGLGVLAAIALAAAAAVMLGRRIAAPIGSLAAAAKALASGAQAKAPAAGLQEVREVGQALVEASSAVRAREGALRAADRAKDEFLAMLSHELRNPLNALSAAAQVLRIGAPREHEREATEVIGRQVGHMARLVEDLLDVSRVTRGKVSLARAPLDLARVAEKTVREWRVSGRLAQHAVSLELSPAWAQADEARIEQIVSNLLGNAVKYTPAGGRITVSVAREQGAAVLRVRDTGVGMAPELAGRAFDLFVQGERSLDRGPGGLGIGLTLVKRLAELHGGQAFAASSGPGEGSLFGISLPAIEARGEAPAPAPAPAPPAAPAARRHRILVVEDNDDARRSLAMALKLEGHEVLEAADGNAGIAAARAGAPEVAVIDVGLPGMDGYQVAGRLRGAPACESMLLVALTGYGEPEARRRAREAGFDEHVTKPIAPGELMRLIDAALYRRERRFGTRALARK